MPKAYKVYLEDMLEAARKILAAAEIPPETFSTDWIRADAVRYNFVVLGEIAKRLPDSFTAQYPEIPWRKIAGLRNRLAHEYEDIYLETLWDIIQADVQQLAAELSRILHASADPDADH